MSKVHLFTGATGFVGGAMVLELLCRTDDQIACVVRPRKDGTSTQTYLENQLYKAARAYGLSHLLSEIPSRCQAIEWDLSSALSGEIKENIGDISEVWHCAASLEYQEQHKEKIFQHNVYGTQNIINLARSCKAKQFNYISTAYVAGKTTGFIFEDILPSAELNNCYEQSKHEAEKLVYEVQDMHTRIMRPSIVIGHSKTYQAISSAGLYSIIRQVNVFKYKASKLPGISLKDHQLRVQSDKDTPFNLIPVDVVASNAVKISLSNSSERIFHLANTSCPTVGQTVDSVLREFGLREAYHTIHKRNFTSLDEKLHESFRFFWSYFKNPKTFDVTNVKTSLESQMLEVPLDEKALQPYIKSYMSQLIKTSKNKGKQLVENTI